MSTSEQGLQGRSGWRKGWWFSGRKRRIMSWKNSSFYDVKCGKHRAIIVRVQQSKWPGDWSHQVGHDVCTTRGVHTKIRTRKSTNFLRRRSYCFLWLQGHGLFTISRGQNGLSQHRFREGKSRGRHVRREGRIDRTRWHSIRHVRREGRIARTRWHSIKRKL